VADFLVIKRERLSWATREGIVERNPDGSYQPETATGQWLKYERSRSALKSKHRELERERARLVRAKAEAAERKLALLDRSLINSTDMIESVKTVCLRIKSKLQAAIPRIARSCYHAVNLTEALKNSGSEFDLLISELSALENAKPAPQFEVVHANGESVERSAADEGPGERSD